jgi:predicted nucleic acid-binding protein
MKLVVDTNILIKALIKRAKVYSILLNPNYTFYVPEHCFDEIERHIGIIEQKSGLSRKEIKLVLDALKSNIVVVSHKDVIDKYKEAEEIIGSVDENDIPVVAAALAADCNGIWSDDKGLKKQDKVKVWNTKEMLELALRKQS